MTFTVTHVFPSAWKAAAHMWSAQLICMTEKMLGLPEEKRKVSPTESVVLSAREDVLPTD